MNFLPPSVDPNDQKKTACYDIDVEVDDTLKTQMNSFLLSTASQQEIAGLDNKVRTPKWTRSLSSVCPAPLHQPTALHQLTELHQQDLVPSCPFSSLTTSCGEVFLFFHSAFKKKSVLPTAAVAIMC